MNSIAIVATSVRHADHKPGIVLTCRLWLANRHLSQSGGRYTPQPPLDLKRYHCRATTTHQHSPLALALRGVRHQAEHRVVSKQDYRRAETAELQRHAVSAHLPKR